MVTETDIVLGTAILMLVVAIVVLWFKIVVSELRSWGKVIEHYKDQGGVNDEIYANVDKAFDSLRTHNDSLLDVWSAIKRLINVNEISDKQIRYGARIDANHSKRIFFLERRLGKVHKINGNRIPRKKNRRHIFGHKVRPRS